MKLSERCWHIAHEARPQWSDEQIREYSYFGDLADHAEALEAVALASRKRNRALYIERKAAHQSHWFIVSEASYQRAKCYLTYWEMQLIDALDHLQELSDD